jgi:hypothetical protein
MGMLQKDLAAVEGSSATRVGERPLLTARQIPRLRLCNKGIQSLVCTYLFFFIFFYFFFEKNVVVNKESPTT